MGIDSAHQSAAATFSELQPEIPSASIADDGGKPTLEHFLVYRCNKFNGGEKKPHGLALVIANEKFQGLPQRLCANVDTQRLKKSLASLGYRVEVRSNQTAEQMERIFEIIGGGGGGRDKSLQVRKEDDSFICIISSHGDWDEAKNTDVIYGSDKGTIDLQETVYENLGTTKCELLKGKPKMFFVQACRGGQFGRIAADSSESRLPHESDFLISYSTAPQTKAFRYDPNKAQPEGAQIDLTGQQSFDRFNVGSFYITEICLAFDNFARKMDLMTMVLFVHQRLQASDKMLFKLGSTTTRQCPHMSVSLRGAVFFFDKAEEIFRDHVKQWLK